MAVAGSFQKAIRLSRKKERSDPSRPQDEITPTLGEIFAFAMARSSKSYAGNDQLRRTDFVSVFDVDGPCLVAVPYSSEWELVPHPEYRSMSIGWVVEPAETPPEESSDPAKYQVIGKVKGMWEIMAMPRETYEFV
ncbi:hypothetical protein F5X68DRAFT_226664 [Plectosphaerella plurivora]|uniref:Uncharacterized protein n=1 Tax=Plectosphaerella plurivora TaxID=936078 RepID=A0A9P8VPD0_9PEZI|nr:hypothetical protein F5X68DRAFT_226664 [Plectosphaerella plurivora]